MINKFEIVDLLEISSWSDIEDREQYKFDVDPSVTTLDDVIAYYDLQNDQIHCGLKNCHQPHHMGYLVKTSDGYETNIGNYCGRKHFGKDFAIQKNVFNAERRLQNYRKLLNEVVYNSDDIFGHIKMIRQQGADWLNKSVNNFRLSYPRTVVAEIRSRAERGNDNLYIDRARTEKELEAAQAANPSAKEESLRYVSEYAGRIEGLHIFTRSIRDVLVIELENRLSELLVLDSDTSVHKLKSWYDWAQDIDNLFAEADLLIEEGQKFFTRENFKLVRDHLARDNDLVKIDQTIWNFTAGEVQQKPIKKKKK